MFNFSGCYGHSSLVCSAVSERVLIYIHVGHGVYQNEVCGLPLVIMAEKWSDNCTPYPTSGYGPAVGRIMVALQGINYVITCTVTSHRYGISQL